MSFLSAENNFGFKSNCRSREVILSVNENFALKIDFWTHNIIVWKQKIIAQKVIFGSKIISTGKSNFGFRSNMYAKNNFESESNVRLQKVILV